MRSSNMWILKNKGKSKCGSGYSDNTGLVFPIMTNVMWHLFMDVILEILYGTMAKIQ